jgi:hypothetical protein
VLAYRFVPWFEPGDPVDAEAAQFHLVLFHDIIDKRFLVLRR